jgi:flagellar M-ring protein FliF
MGKLSEGLKNVLDKVKKMSTKSKIAIGLLLVAVIIGIISIIYYSNSNKYALLMTVDNTQDGKIVTEKLQEKKVDTKIKGNSIYVPKEMVDELRLAVAPDLTNGSKGWELLDEGSAFGITDDEFKLKRQRILQGELEKTIKAFSQVENARVLLTMPQDSVFVKDSTPGKAAVYLKLKAGSTLSAEQVKSIVALVSGSVQNMPKENIEVVDDKMNLLSKNIFDENAEMATQTALEKQVKTETDFEKKLEKQLLELLEPAIGKNKVNVKVNADLDFDSKEKTTLTYDPNKVEVSTHTIKEVTNSAGENTSQSPVDNNMNNTIVEGSTGNNGTTREENTTNYNVGKTETRTISAPGEIKRLTSSVMIDGKLDEATKAEIEKAVAGVMGFKADRGDSISVVGMNFDPAIKEANQAAIDEMEEQLKQQQRMALYKYGAIGGSALLGLIIILILILKSRKRKGSTEVSGAGIDVVIKDAIEPKERVEFNPLDFEVHDERTHIENEVKKYATEKPEQVADIIKSWLTEDER